MIWARPNASSLRLSLFSGDGTSDGRIEVLSPIDLQFPYGDEVGRSAGRAVDADGVAGYRRELESVGLIVDVVVGRIGGCGGQVGDVDPGAGLTHLNIQVVEPAAVDE